jgi:hypothetical protein
VTKYLLEQPRDAKGRVLVRDYEQSGVAYSIEPEDLEDFRHWTFSEEVEHFRATARRRSRRS